MTTDPSPLRGSTPASSPASDVYVLSFPKCGRTWLRVLMAKAISLHWGLPMELCRDLRLEEFSAVDPRIPTITFWHDDRVGWRTPAQLSTDKEPYRGSRVVFLTRDLRDTTVSYYFQRSLRPDNPYAGPLGEFIGEAEGSLRTCVEFWNIWQARQDVPRAFLLTSYERLASDTAGELGRIMDFCGLPDVGPRALAEAVAFASFPSMRAMELSDAFDSERLRPGKPGEPESFKTRRGIIGGFRDYLTRSQTDGIDELIRTALVPEWHALAFAADGLHGEPPGAAQS
ncbi:sulfotransferase domain-containing protein [Streptomyces sp. NBC_00536]|uniref:sulfotransferase domain-containing protein n=1 Tax=Streptomyces sp. NBC_00536 TaxID=2975769 RepID=UPI002E8178D1|nr:sulfotransferase domain-containing protein [Streptomyces sp. NBC_00536]WUC82440.1 sulfotransferase domain-containing protein [Streptomyces sp. NBC_00536]